MLLCVQLALSDPSCGKRSCGILGLSSGNVEKHTLSLHPTFTLTPVVKRHRTLRLTEHTTAVSLSFSNKIFRDANIATTERATGPASTRTTYISTKKPPPLTGKFSRRHSFVQPTHRRTFHPPRTIDRQHPSRLKRAKLGGGEGLRLLPIWCPKHCRDHAFSLLRGVPLQPRPASKRGEDWSKFTRRGRRCGSDRLCKSRTRAPPGRQTWRAPWRFPSRPAALPITKQQRHQRHN